MKLISLFLILFSSLFAAPTISLPSFLDESDIGLQNTILYKVNETPISMLDVKKRMDIRFHQLYPDLVDSSQARFQFYEVSWRPVLNEIIDEELILSDAKDKEVSLSDGEVREEIERRFGPRVMRSLEKIGLSYEEASKIVKNDLIAKRMTGWFIQMKGMQKVTPQDIRNAYRTYLKEHPPYQEWSYHVLTLRGDQAKEQGACLFEKLQKMLAAQDAPLSPTTLEGALKAIAPSVGISPLYHAKDEDLSEAHRLILSSLKPGEYSAPLSQKSKVNQEEVVRIFYLDAVTAHQPPQFEEVAILLRDELMQKAIAAEAEVYLGKLRAQYGYDQKEVESSLPEDFHPFVLR